jgi:predicted ATPase
MIINYSVSGFKCFSNSNFHLKNITILAGSNGTGKSSFIQALLLARIGIERNLHDSSKNDYLGDSWKGKPIPLNDGFELKLGGVNDIFNNDKNSKNIITIKLNEDIFELLLPDQEEDNLSVQIVLKESIIDNSMTPFWRKKEFYYLNTERLGPRLGLDSNHTEFLHCGHKGEYTAQVLLKNEYFKINDIMRFPEVKSYYLRQQVDAWLNSICPGTDGVTSKRLGSTRSQITLLSSAAKGEILATNIGFGISYALPIIVNGLIAEPGSVFIVENPEAHLHPKGQSNIGFFLGKVAATGVTLIIETHSEHVINGIRRASLSTEGLKPTDVSIYFFRGFDTQGKQNIKEISVNESGDLSDFPKDFFDQVNQDMAEIFRLKSKIKNG